MIVCPMSRRIRSISIRTLPITAIDEIASAVARKTANTVRSTPGPSRLSGSTIPSANPEAIGSSNPPAATPIAVRAW